jgi:hypothetical protein
MAAASGMEGLLVGEGELAFGLDRILGGVAKLLGERG